ncbi:hypothetical protein [Jejuia pallidilutea]|uniref:Surface antigen protein n=1 Tax=Jejuia pallidilutea TaxID=504487 RepID=A0A090W4A5_9FLAO|nr:hypothetical protein [Jejuia pallidilutea]GAL71845.1 surface antigen gene [Jejuia pallidilutea]GAL90247.1 surface antigen gene [Jejuia pallidilutea]
MGTFAFLSSCLSDDLPGVGDLVDLTGPSPSFNFDEITTSQFTCDEVLIFANYEIYFQAGSNLAVNGTQYEWSISEIINETEEIPVTDIEYINSQRTVLVASIKALKADVIAIEEDIEELELKLPCETDQVKINAILAKIDALEIALQAANDAITEDIRESIADLENQISNLPAGTVNDQNVIVAFPGPGTYKVALKVTDNNGWSNTIDENITIIEAVPTIPVPEIGEPSFEDNSLPDGTGDGRDSWRVPSNSAWSPTGGGTTVIQINTDTNPVDPPNLPDGRQAAKFPAGGSRVAYQEIEVTPGAEYVLTYHSAFEVTQYADLKVSILKPETSNYAESLLEDNIIASRTDNNIDRVDNIWRQHALSFEAGDNESVIIFVTNSGDESRLDFFEILVKQ